MKNNSGNLDIYQKHTPVRRVVTPSGGIIRGKFPSKKNGRMIKHEGLLEADAILHFEMCVDVEKYREQPYKVRYLYENKLRIYTPDFEVVLKDGEVIIVEIKHSFFLNQPEIKEKYMWIEKHFKRQGITYIIITEKNLRLEPKISNLRKGYHLLTKVEKTPEKLKLIINKLIQNKLYTVNEFNALVCKYGLNVYDFLVGGLLSCNIHNQINDETEVKIIEDSDNGWLRFF